LGQCPDEIAEAASHGASELKAEMRYSILDFGFLILDPPSFQKNYGGQVVDKWGQL